MKPVHPVLRHLIHSQDEEVLSNACWALSHLSDGSDDKIQAVIEARAFPQLVKLLSRDDVHIQRIIDHHALPYLLNILTANQNKGIKHIACRIISNIMSGNKEQIQSVINGNMIGPLVHLMQTAEFDVRHEAAWAITNATSCGTDDQKRYLVSQGCIKAFCGLLSYADTSILSVCLVGLENILKVGLSKKYTGACDVNMYAQMIEDAGDVDKIENLQTHGNNTIVEIAACLLESYLSKEDAVMPWDDAHLSYLSEEPFSDSLLDIDFG